MTIQISALEKYLYCPRQCALIHVEGLWVESGHTARGSLGHSRADTPGSRRERGRVVVRSVPLFSESLDLVGRADAVEIDSHGTVTPVEYKMGVSHGRAADVQLCAQAFCLEEMFGIAVTSGAVWYSGLRRRVPVVFDERLRSLTHEAIAQVQALLDSDRLPVAPNDQRCDECQLVSVCLPTITDGSGLVEEYLREVM